MSESNLDNRFMEFRLGGQLFAIPLLSVKEVIPKPDITLVPNMPSHFEGMINLRGQILGVFNIRKKLAAKARDATDKTADVVIVIEQQGVSVGMIVDEVTKVLHAGTDMIGPAPLKEDDPARHFIGSVIQTGEDLVMTIHVGKLLELEKYKLAV
ncbi:MAG: chemotaxis protein CheW [Bdellovibrionota bacterium]